MTVGTSPVTAVNGSEGACIIILAAVRCNG